MDTEIDLQFLLEWFDQLFLYHSNEIDDRAARDEWYNLAAHLFQMSEDLRDAKTRYKKDEIFQAWEGQISDMVYTIENTISTTRQVVAQQTKGTSTFQRLFKARSPLTMAKEIQSLRLDKLLPLLNYGFADFTVADQPGTSVEKTTEVALKAPREEDTMIGLNLENEASLLIDRLTWKPEEFGVVSIVGMMSVGKTALASKIYNHWRIKKEFPNRIWLHVSQALTIKEMLLSFLRELTSEDHSGKSRDELLEIVHEYLEIGKFFIIMDDVWEWEDIAETLLAGRTMCKVLMTTRHSHVANIASEYVHSVSLLSDEEAWVLLQLQVFGRISECPNELEGLGKQIVKCCGGYKLCIVLIGEVLLRKFSPSMANTKREWEILFQAILTGKKMHAVISCNFDTLPYDLRGCFLYLGVFPYDFEIPTWKLAQLWIAEGFIREDEGMSLDKIARQNVQELINRKLLMADKVSFTGEVKTCRVHADITTYCLSRGKELNLFSVMSSLDRSSESVITKIHQCHRLSVHSYMPNLRCEIPNIKARSLLCFSIQPITESKNISHLTDAAGFIRVVETSSIVFDKFPVPFTSLLFLRYLTLSGDEIKFLPKAISNLWNLQTLVVSTKSRTLEIEAILWKMMSLMHLKTKASIILKEGNGEGGDQLCTLTKLSPKSFTHAVSTKVKNLTKLGIRGNISLLRHLRNLYCLEKLTLEHDVYPQKNSVSPLRGLPPSADFPPIVKILVLSRTYLQWKHMSTLGEISTLEVLELKDNAFTGSAWEVSDGGFTRLEALSIKQANLKYWTAASNNSFPNLTILELRNCEKLQDVPFELVKKLETLSMSGVTRFAVSCARKIEADRAATGGFNLHI